MRKKLVYAVLFVGALAFSSTLGWRYASPEVKRSLASAGLVQEKTAPTAQALIHETHQRNDVLEAALLEILQLAQEEKPDAAKIQEVANRALLAPMQQTYSH